jgi:hypothetical protein
MSDFSICPDPDHREALYDSSLGDYSLPLVSVLRRVAFILASKFVCRSWQTLI